jgi:hypothetical protein
MHGESIFDSLELFYMLKSWWLPVFDTAGTHTFILGILGTFRSATEE